MGGESNLPPKGVEEEELSWPARLPCHCLHPTRTTPCPCPLPPPPSQVLYLGKEAEKERSMFVDPESGVELEVVDKQPLVRRGGERERGDGGGETGNKSPSFICGGGWMARPESATFPVHPLCPPSPDARWSGLRTTTRTSARSWSL